MKRFAILFSLIFCTSILIAQSLVASTVMVTISARMSNDTVSPQSMDRVQKMVLDIEDSALGQAFNSGHIAFNIPASVQLSSSKENAPTLASIAKIAKDGGAAYLITCTTECAELSNDAPLAVRSCTVRMYPVGGPVAESTRPSFEKILKLDSQTKDTDMKALVAGPFQELIDQVR